MQNQIYSAIVMQAIDFLNKLKDIDDNWYQDIAIFFLYH